MFRKLILSSVAILTTMCCLANPAKSDAGVDIRIGVPVYAPPVVVPAPAPVLVAQPAYVVPAARWDVVYRRCLDERWHEYGTYPCHADAHVAAASLRGAGYHVRVVLH
jgi:hypothetical protein